MKRLPISFYRAVSACLILLMVFACEKPILTEEDEQEDATGNLRVSVLQIEQTAFDSLTRTAVADVCTRLNIAVYDMDGKRVKQVNQESTQSGFGTCLFQLEKGTYQLVVVAHSSHGNPTMTDMQSIKFTNALGYSDTFMCCDTVTIGEGMENRSVALHRIVALCRLEMTDSMPAEVKKMRFYYTGGSGAFDAHTGLGCVKSKQEVVCNIAEGRTCFDLYTIPLSTECTIHLLMSALDAKDKELYQRELDVPMAQNRITHLTGAFFTTADVTMPTIDVNTRWEGETHLSF